MSGRGLSFARLRFADDALEREFLVDYASGDRLRHGLLWMTMAAVGVAMRIADSAVATPDGIFVARTTRHFVTIPVAMAVAACALLPQRLWTRSWQAVTTLGAAVFFSTAPMIEWALTWAGFPVPTGTVHFICTILTAGGLITYSMMSLRLGHAIVAAAIPAVLHVAHQLTHPGESPALTRYVIFWMISVVSFGMISGHQIERLRRQDFLRRRQIEEAKARSEEVLTAEVRHQVAARSRELSDVLARTDVDAQGAALMVGERFAARYRVLEKLGEGGMGAVYAVERSSDEKRLALKVITGHASGSAAARFAREAEIGARTRHSNLVAILDVGVARGVPYLVMELLGGGSLETRRARFGERRWAIGIIQQVAEGLAALHRAGVIHRDLKPGNVLFVGDGDEVKIGDFGISRNDAWSAAADSDGDAATIDAHAASPKPITMTGVMLGTPIYMAPECARGGRGVQAHTDVFAFGVLAFELLTGRLPFSTPPVYAALAGTPLAPPDLLEGDGAASWVARCLDPLPERRPTMPEVLELLSASPSSR